MKRLIAIAAVLGLLGLIGYRIYSHQQNEKALAERQAQVTLPTVTTDTTQRRVLESRVVVTGTIRPANEIDIFARVAGQVVQIKGELGQQVEKGDVLAVIEPDLYAFQLGQAKASLAMAQANLATAEKGAASAETLSETQNIADMALVQARSGREAARAQVAGARASVGLASEALSNTRVTSPITGVISRKGINIGTLVAPGAMVPSAALYQVQDRSYLKIDASIDEREIAFVKVGQEVRVEVDAWPGESFPGRVKLIAPTLDPLSRRAAIEIVLDSPDPRLLGNMFARATIVQPSDEPVLTVPRSALVRQAEGQVVFVLEGDVARMKPVKLGETDGTWIEVIEGLTEGETFLASGHSRLTDGAKVMVSTQTSARQ